MRNPTAAINRCTAMRRGGEFCDAPGMIDMPFPICRKHAEKVYERWAEHLGATARGTAEMFAEEFRKFREADRDPEHVAHMKRRDAALQAQSQVYYLRIGEHIKIGVTVNMKARLSQLRVDPDALLATEPGDAKLEAQRHREFANERVGRRENFNPSRRLIAHIAEVRALHGEPKITGYPNVA